MGKCVVRSVFWKAHPESSLERGLGGSRERGGEEARAQCLEKASDTWWGQVAMGGTRLLRTKEAEFPGPANGLGECTRGSGLAGMNVCALRPFPRMEGNV